MELLLCSLMEVFWFYELNLLIYQAENCKNGEHRFPWWVTKSDAQWDHSFFYSCLQTHRVYMLGI